jgi:hypothetical protein
LLGRRVDLLLPSFVSHAHNPFSILQVAAW